MDEIRKAELGDLRCLREERAVQGDHGGSDSRVRPEETQDRRADRQIDREVVPRGGDPEGVPSQFSESGK